jgi:serine protease AprX
MRRPNGITLTGADGITLTGADGITLTGADGVTKTALDGITLTGADAVGTAKANGITLTGADGITLTGADRITGFGPAGVLFNLANPTGITLTGADGIAMTAAQGITLTGADGIHMLGLDGITLTGADSQTGIQGLDPDLALALNNATDDSSINAVVVFHHAVTDADTARLQQVGIWGGTRFRRLPMVYVSGTRQQLIAVSHFPEVRSIYGNRTLDFNSDPYFVPTGNQRVFTDNELATANSGMPISGRGVTVAVLDTGINSTHPDLAGRVVQNVRLVDAQSAPSAFLSPIPVENMANTDLAAGHGTFVSGIIVGSGASSGGKYNGVAPGANLLGLSAGDVNLTGVLSGFDYLLEKGSAYNVRVVNCSFSANTPFDLNDPVNIATKMITDAGINVVFSAGNSGPGNGSLNPYAAAPWVVSVGAADQNGVLAPFSSRGNFGDALRHPTLVAPAVNVISLRSAVGITGIEGLVGADAQRLSLGELPYYTTASGTSFSAPQAAGAIAMMLQANPSLTPADVKDIISRTATPMPKYFYHEAGAGMLNTYAAVVQAAFPSRQIGMFRSTTSRNQISFVTSQWQTFNNTVVPGSAASINIPIPANTVQAAVGIAWGFGLNDLGLQVFDGANHLAGESNNANLPGLSGRSENVALRSPQPQTFRAAISHTAGVGTEQSVAGSVELTQVKFPELLDLASLSAADQTQLQYSLLSNLMFAEGRNFRPAAVVSRVDLAAGLIRSGRVPLYVTSVPMYPDVLDIFGRNAVESVQNCPGGKLFYDTATGPNFNPNEGASRLVAAVALVRAAGLTSAAGNTALPPTITDAASIPGNLRGFTAVALQYGFLKLDGTRFNGDRLLTRMELAAALNRIVGR